MRNFTVCTLFCILLMVILIGSNKVSSSTENVNEDWSPSSSQCTSADCMLREQRQYDTGPFWANRGKRDPAPTYTNDRLYVEEPRWMTLMRRFDVGRGIGADPRGNAEDDDYYLRYYDPFFTTRGKKADVRQGLREQIEALQQSHRERRGDEAPFFAARGRKDQPDTPFFAARGKKEEQDTPFFAARGKKDRDE